MEYLREDLKGKIIASSFFILLFIVGLVVYSFLYPFIPRYITSFIEFLSLISVIIIGVATFVMILKYRIINGVDESGENT